MRGGTFFKEIPSFRILIFLILGIIIADSIRDTDGLSMHLVLILIIVALITLARLYSYNNLFFSTLSNTSIIIFGYLICTISLPEYDNSHYLNHDKEHLTAIAEIIEEPKPGKSLRTVLNIKKSKYNDGEWYKSSGDLLVYLPIDSTTSTLKAGDKILIDSKLHALQPNQNPLAFDYKSYLYYKGIRYQSFIRSDDWSYIGHPEQYSITTVARSMRQKCASILAQHIKDTDNLAIASAMLLGLRNNLSEEIYQAYTDTGAVHVLAVSGLHVGYINAILLFILSLFLKGSKTAEYIRAILIIIGIWLFALITGAAPAVLRAATMFSMLTVGIVIFKKYNIYNILAGSAIALLIFDPHLLFQGSFQFSYLALFSILYWQPKLSKVFYVKNKYIKYIINLLLVAVAAQVLVFPVTILYFHKFASSFLISGIVAIILAAGVIWGGLALIAAHYLDLVANALGFSLSYVVDFIAYTLDSILSLFIYLIKCIQSLPYSNIDKIWIEPYEMMLIYVILGLVMFWISFGINRALHLIMIVLIILIGGRIKRDVSIKSQAQIICYDVQKEMAVDFINGNSAYTLSTIDGDHKILRFARDNYRMHLGVTEFKAINNTDINNVDFIKSGGIIQFLEKTIAIAHDTLTDWQYLDTIDLLLIGDINQYKLAKQISNKKINHIVINHNMNSYKIRHVKSLLDSIYDNVHYVGDQAFKLNVQQ